MPRRERDEDQRFMPELRGAYDDGVRASRGQSRLQHEHPGNGKYGGYPEEHENDRFVYVDEGRDRAPLPRGDVDSWRSPLAHYWEEGVDRRFSTEYGHRGRREPFVIHRPAARPKR